MSSLGANKLRAGLTMLGVIIGVGAVIALVSIGRGAQAAITSQIESIGTNLLFVRPGSAQQEGGVRGAQGSAGTLTLEDGNALRDVSGVVGIAPEVDAFGQVSFQGNNSNVRIIGVTPEYADVRSFHASSGEFINASNVTANSLVACLGSEVASTLFGDTDPLRQSMRVNLGGSTTIPIQVQCVLESKGGTGFLSQDNQIFVPITTAQTRLSRGQRFRGGNNVDVLNVQLADSSIGPQVTEEIGNILRDRHRVIQDDFQVQSQQDILNSASAITGALTLFLGGVAAISLIVGGIGIMNIMLVSVTERTREIGIRKAVGAKRRDILAQFLTEATVLSGFGGVIGTLLGWGIAQLVGNVSLGTTTIKPVVGADAVALAVGFSVAIGLFFGIYPAFRASALNPIDALRYE